MSKQARGKRRKAVRLLDQAVRNFKRLAVSSISHKPNTDTSVATFERYVKRLEKLADVPGQSTEFWPLHQRVYIRLLKHILKLRD
jgi:hypothetical protein